VNDDNEWAALWPLDPAVAFLNHGSYGACPREVLRHQADLRAEMEAEPVRFLGRDLDDRLDAARAALGAFVGADPDDLAFVSNATGGVNAVLRSLRLQPGDELLTTDHAYQACRNTLDFVAERSGARVVAVTLPFPVTSPQAIVDTVMAGVTPRTRLALLDHITSPTALILPIGPLVAALAARGSRAWWTARTRPAWCRSICARSARPTTAATATSGSARRRAPRSSSSVAIARPTSIR